jgi:hypothetical protein
MIERANFFVASLWASLVPIALMVLTCVGLLLFPLTGEWAQAGTRAGQLGLILVPFAYTGLVVTTYCVARGLHAVRVLNRWTLPVAYVLLAVAAAGIFSKISSVIGFSAGASVTAFLIVFGLGLVALLAACWIWWRVASRPSPLDIEAVRRAERRQRREERRAERRAKARNEATGGQSGGR